MISARLLDGYVYRNVAANSSGMLAVQVTPIVKLMLSLDSAATASSRLDVPLACERVHSRVTGLRSTFTRRTVGTNLPLPGR